MSIGQTLIAVVGIVFPTLTSVLMREYGFRGTAAVFSAFSLHLVLAACTFQPVKWHCKLKLVTDAIELETRRYFDAVSNTQESYILILLKFVLVKSYDKSHEAADYELNEFDTMLEKNNTEKDIPNSNENPSKIMLKW